MSEDDNKLEDNGRHNLKTLYILVV